MGKKFLKWLIPLSFGAVLFGASFSTPQETPISAEVYTSTPVKLNATKSVSINNEPLRNYLLSVFKKTSQQSFKSDDFMNSPLFAPTTTEDENGATVTTIPTYQLDLSNTGITDIRELAQFEFPENIKAINLSGNGITNSHLDSISEFTSLAKDSELTIGDKTVTVMTDFSTNILAVNLNNNNINLTETSQTLLDNSKLLFGVQNINNIDKSGMVKKGEINPSFYIRSTGDENFLSYTFTNGISTEIGASIIQKDEVVSLSDIGLNDKYTFLVKSIPDSPTAGFDGYNFKVEFTQFDISIDDEFFVERKHLLDLRITSAGKILSDSPLNLDGFGNNESIKVSYNNVSTTRITSDSHKNYVNITIEKDDEYKIIPIEFTIKDTIKPVIKLIGSHHAYLSRNKNYDDPGVIAYDPTYVGDESGDDLSAMVVTDDTNVNVTVLGTYTIKYSVSDIAGNKTEITRILEIQEKVLDNITLRINSNDEIQDGDDIVLVVQPDNDIPISNYKDIKYYWYLNGTLIQETNGDSVSGKSTYTILANAETMRDIYVRVTATQKSDNAQIELFSNTITLNISPSLRNDNTLIIAAAIAVLIIIIIITIITIIKYRKSKGKTHGKHKNFHKNKKPKKGQKAEAPKDDKPEIQVIKNYSGTGTGTGSNGGTGGNANFRPPENKSDGMDK